MPDAVKDSGWNRRFKSHDKANKRLMTGAEAAEKDAKKREQAAERAMKGPAEEHTEGPMEERTEGPAEEAEEEEAEEEEAEEEEQAVEDAFLPPPSTAPAKIQVSRAGRKRALTTKALEAEQAPKRGIGQGRGRGRGRGSGGPRRHRERHATPRSLYRFPV